MNFFLPFNTVCIVYVQFATLTELPTSGGGPAAVAAVDGGSLAVCGGIQRHRFVFQSRSNHVQLRVVPSVETRFLLRFEGRSMTTHLAVQRL